jgi:hypothetical protein
VRDDVNRAGNGCDVLRQLLPTHRDRFHETNGRHEDLFDLWPRLEIPLHAVEIVDELKGRRQQLAEAQNSVCKDDLHGCSLLLE